MPRPTPQAAYALKLFVNRSEPPVTAKPQAQVSATGRFLLVYYAPYSLSRTFITTLHSQRNTRLLISYRPACCHPSLCTASGNESHSQLTACSIIPRQLTSTERPQPVAYAAITPAESAVAVLGQRIRFSPARHVPRAQNPTCCGCQLLQRKSFALLTPHYPSLPSQKSTAKSGCSLSRRSSRYEWFGLHLHLRSL